MKLIVKILDVLFIICTVVFIFMMVAMVAVQCVSLVTLNGPLSSSALAFTEPIAGAISAVAAIAAFILLYLRKSESDKKTS
jgi:uncharacterized membrane protein (Fun14 family)